jgi:hypothetical protein
MEKTPQPEGREKESTPQELAQSWLSFKQEEVEKSIKMAQHGLRFSQTYQPKYPTEKGELGSMDESDYKVASLEVDEWMHGGREDTIAHDEIRLAELHREVEELVEMRTKIEQGDTKLVELFAAYERERRQRISAAETLKNEREGKEFEGAEKASAQIKEIWDLVKSGNTKMGKVRWAAMQSSFPYLLKGTNSVCGTKMLRMFKLTLRKKENGVKLQPVGRVYSSILKKMW